MAEATSRRSQRKRKAKKRVSFTPEQAEKALVYVHKVVLDLVDADYEAARLVSDNDTTDAMTASLDRLEALSCELEAMGLRVHDSARGVVWFPARHQGNRAWLVWRLDKPDRLSWCYDGDHADERPIETFGGVADGGV